MGFITAKIGLIRMDNTMEILGIESKQNSTYYDIDIRLENIGAIYPIPDEDGIPRKDYVKINVFGIEYVIVYPYLKLRRELGIL